MYMVSGVVMEDEIMHDASDEPQITRWSCYEEEKAKCLSCTTLGMMFEYCIKKLGIPIEGESRGGAIALGHPLGCTGARQMSTLLYQLKRKNQRYGVISMCIGTGMGAAAVIEREP
ncbi:unnamed protein product [Peronospora farinosa]|uniref:Thiolase C-terminal domain-containing protein n=1 Tax=Peronospora farinosa TaxID=134698 RepID=A0ABN8CCC8_9STRA|nr:unnamed protein product [Peronospora farinosa]